MNMTKSMTRPTQPGTREPSAFTLIELLVVMGIIAILAAMIFPAGKPIRERATRKKVQTELHQLQTVIDSYKAKFGFYPPDNDTNRPALNQLYFELQGTTRTIDGVNEVYRTLDGSVTNTANQLTNAFGPNVRGFVNCSKGDADDAVPAVNFLKGLKPGQFVEGTISGVPIKILTTSVRLPSNQLPPLPAFVPTDPDARPNPWCYNSSSPTHNPDSYDLWVDVLIGGKTNRISNWSEQPQFVN
jgi:prepilin-type N-terminal cleavage/methylation domain-containing protein